MIFCFKFKFVAMGGLEPPTRFFLGALLRPALCPPELHSILYFHSHRVTFPPYPKVI